MQYVNLLRHERKWVQNRLIGSFDGIVDNTDSIEYFVNRLHLSSAIYGFKELNNEIENLQKDEAFDHVKFAFQERYYKKINNVPAMVIMCNPKDSNVKSVMWIKPPLTTLSNLIKLTKNFPYLKISQCEYASDFFSSVPHLLYDILLESLYIPDVKDCIKNKNSKTHHKTNRMSKSKFIKMYECGNREDKVEEINGEKTWPYDKCNRVRFEFTVERREFNDAGVSTLSDLIHTANFYKFLKTRFRSARSMKNETEPKWQRIITIMRKAEENKNAARSIAQYLDKGKDEIFVD